MGTCLLMLLAFYGTVSLAEASKCDEDTIKKIKELWGEHSPKILETAVANGKEVVIATTPFYYDVDRKCVYSIFVKDKDQYKIINTEVPKSGSAITTVLPINEYEGYTNVPEKTVRRYYVLYEGGVQLLYKCSTDGEIGPAEAAIKVRASGYDKDKLSEARDIAKKLDMNLSTEFPESCLDC
ncbi:uncharacterized protein LOC124361418 [Homalodisca vitripennis]|uniref:uncharacterized protein LOC124361418 n=1 Tax=Homalodisca vitripennis TaxID=197043 RepID=UPI001EEB8A87|nr:uncharacterized protein LOC124361418 [Homalodisca vitripennis]